MGIISVTKDTFDQEVINSKNKVLIDFNASWCGPCRMLGPVLESLSEEKKNIRFVSIDTDEEDELAMEYQVFSIPCLVLIENGKEIKRNVGLISKSELEEFIGE